MVDSAHVILSLADCAAALGIRPTGADAGLVFTGVSTDSRTVGAGELFVALVGDTRDGHEFIGDAAARGAAGFVVTAPNEGLVPAGAACLPVADTLFALGELARFHRGRLLARVVGITGSNGKTTTKEITAAVAGTSFRTAKSEGNLNNLIGLPMMLLSASPDTEVIILEMGMNVPGEIKRLSEIARPDVGVVTNVGPVHLEGVGSIEGVIREKGRLLASLSKGGVAVFEGDTDYSGALREQTRARPLTFGLDKGSDVRAEKIEDLGGGGTRFRLASPSGSGDVRLPIPGIHNLKNALAAAAVGVALGVPVDSIGLGIESAAPMKMRMEIRPGKGGIVVLDDSYNANPVSTTAALEFLAREGKDGRGRLIAVLGDMLELGDFSQAGHEAVGAAAARAGVGHLFLLGDHSADIARGAAASGPDERVIFTYPKGTHDRLIQDLVGIVRPGDLVLVKGSRGMKMEKIANALIE
jgi:UDP-N-acetylmuramoyl-tripeptide--D-alanyl-D-alanine ligase